MSTLRNSLISGGIEFYYTFVIHRWYVNGTYHQCFCRYTPVTLLVHLCYGAMIQHWYSIISISQSDYRYATDTLPIHYQYTTDTNQWYRDIHGISISHVLVHQNYSTRARSRAKARVAARSEDHCLHERLGWRVWPGCGVLCACMLAKSSWAHGAAAAIQPGHAGRHVSTRIVSVSRAYFRRGEWDGYDTVSLPYHTYHICITKSWRTYLPDCKWVDWNTVSYVYHHHEHCIIMYHKHTRWYVHDTAWYIRDTCQFELIHSGSWYILNTVANTSWYMVIRIR
jgi:hypothetical protein